MSKKILVVEDDQSFFNLISMPLSQKDCQIVHVSDGNMAVTSVREEKPDLVILDIILPGINGLDILKELKESEDTKNIKVVMLTNFGTDDNIAKAVEIGADDYFIKYNLVPSEIWDKIAPYLGEESDASVKVTN